MNWNEYILVLIALFAIIDPIGIIPLFLTFTKNIKDERTKVARTVGLTMMAILGMSVFAGEPILNFFNVSLDAFRVAGGILLLFMAIEMLRARHGRERHTPEEDREAINSTSVAMVPLAMPLLAGPGAISTIILLAGEHETFLDKLWLTSCCVLISALTWLIFHFSPHLENRLSATGINIVMRLMGLILAAIAVQFITEGLRHLLPGLN